MDSASLNAAAGKPGWVPLIVVSELSVDQVSSTAARDLVVPGRALKRVRLPITGLSGGIARGHGYLGRVGRRRHGDIPGIRSRVGARHVPLADYLVAFLAAPLRLERVVELGDGIVPWMLGVIARRSG